MEMPMATPKFCSECGTPFSAAAKFCANCGAQVLATASSAPALADPDKAEEPPPAPAKAEAKPAEAPAPAPAAAPADAPKTDSELLAEVESADDVHHLTKASHTGGHFEDPVAALLGAGDDDDDMDDELQLPDGETELEEKAFPLGAVSLGVFFLLMVVGIGYIASDDELNSRFQCNVLGKREACITEEDRLHAIEVQEKKEELELMQHHYGGFDLNFTPTTDASFTLKQTRYEETRNDFVKRIREGDSDRRVHKVEKIGVYTVGKSKEGEIKGRITFKQNAKPPTFEPKEGQELVLPLNLSELPMLEREQIEASNPEKRLSADDIAALEQRRNNPKRDEDGNVIREDIKVKTVAISTWIYEIEMTAPGYNPRRVVFFEQPLPPDLDAKKLEADGVTLRPFKRRPDGRFVIQNASFDLLPMPATIRTRYIQLLKELHCLRKSKEYEGKSEQGKKDSEDLLWEQKAFTSVLREIAEKNHGMPDWEEYKTKEFDGYQCPKAVVTQPR